MPRQSMDNMALEPQTNNPDPTKDPNGHDGDLRQDIRMDHSGFRQSGTVKGTALSCIIDDLMLIHNQLE